MKRQSGGVEPRNLDEQRNVGRKTMAETEQSEERQERCERKRSVSESLSLLGSVTLHSATT